ncbi:hypothetical protein U9M73_13165 [Paenibacillus phoenicis]|uniref:Copper amine oxidase-like N-terminal domain-containing protein n=1 Tax=Paenibacillus phoenicis TaxID=554117 RepID=A0ABU5PLX8_9BACL|nr:hypothetical protein [Paenibacillus phoenicis]MEA3570935.1 hypothetical protein [Paenibacillus phoenicis]
MKKFILGIFVGALLFGAVPAFAESTIDLMRAKITGVFQIEKSDGSKIADAPVINGSAYVPIRALTDATGIPLEVRGKKIILVEKKTAIETAPNQTDPEVLKERLEGLESGAAKYKEIIAETESRLAVSTDAKEIEELQIFLDDLRDRLESYNTMIEEIKAELNE